MAAKSKKAPATKGPVRKPAKKSIKRLQKGSGVAMEGGSDVPDLMPPEVLKQITQVEDFVRNSRYMTNSELARGISAFSKHASGFALSSVKAGASALVYAWACGNLLNTAKSKLGRGDFGAWREEHLGAEAMSERTSQRYMQLAKQCNDIKNLLEWSPTLRQAYIACGVLPEPPERIAYDGEDADAIKRQALLSSITGIQKKLRVFCRLKGKLGVAEKTQLKLAKMEIDEFFGQILG